MACSACAAMGQYGAGEGTTAITKGLLISPSAETAKWLATPIGSRLFDAARTALDTYWTLKPVGSETAGELRDRIASIFIETVSASWTGPATVQAVNNSSDFQKIVADLSPMSEPKKSRAIWWILGAVAVGTVLYFAFKPRGQTDVLR